VLTSRDLQGDFLMTLNEFCDFFKDKKEHYQQSDNFVKKGYGQVSGGYIDCAKCKKIEVDSTNAEPNQKWHLLESYYREENGRSDAKRCYGYLLCPELLLWIAEAAGFDITDVAQEAMQIIDDRSKAARNKAGRKIKEKITWKNLEDRIK